MIRTNNRVALYARFSSDNQRSESIDAQIRAMQMYCKQHNFLIVETYIDEAKTVKLIFLKEAITLQRTVFTVF